MLAYVELGQLRCDRQQNGDGSNPYLWVELLQIDDDTLASGDPILAIPPASPDAEELVVMENMRGGDAAAIPDDVAHYAMRFRDGQTQRHLIVVAALLDHHDTPLDAVSAGYQAFLSEVDDEVTKELLNLSSTDPTTVQAAIDRIKTDVKNKVNDVVEANLSTWDKIQTGLGLETQDNSIDSDFLSTALAEETSTTQFTLTFKSGPDQDPTDLYEVTGELLVKVDPCEDQLLAVDSDANNVNTIKAALKQLGEQAEPDEDQMQKLEDELAAAKAKLKAAEQALAQCRERYRFEVPPTTGADARNR
jgi:hypothetical protein